MQNMNLMRLAGKLQELLGGVPKTTESPFNRYAEMAHHIAYACDYQEDTIFNAIQDYGISSAIRQAIIRDELSREHLANPTELLTQAMAQIKAEDTSSSRTTSDVVYDANALGLPPLPRVLEILTSHVPANFRAPLIIASLPMLGTLATGVHFKYRDGIEHTFSFMSCVLAPSSTGKSFIFHDPARLLLQPIREQDMQAREEERRYKDALQASKNREQQPQNPHAAIREVSISGLSRGRLLELMSYSGGKHLISLAEEIDSMTINNRRGAWASLTDVLRYAFDNSECGQDYKNPDAFSGIVKVFYNLLVAGTPNACFKFFNNVESGLVQRVAFVQLPDMFGQPIPRYRPYTESEANEVVEIAEDLTNLVGEITCPAVYEAIEAWDARKISDALETGSYAIDVLRRRSAVIGYRAGYLAAVLNGSAKWADKTEINAEEAEKAAKFGEWVAEYVFSTQMRLFGAQIERVNKEQRSGLYGTIKIHYLLPKLPDRFTRAELAKVMEDHGGATSLRQNISRWKKNGWIAEQADGSYMKTC